VKQGAVVVGCIHEAGADGHVDGIGAWPVVSAALGRTGQMKGGAVLPSGNDGFASLVRVDLRGGGGLLDDLRKREAVALLDVEDGVIAENEGGAVVLFAGAFVFFLAVAELLVKDNLRPFLSLADGAF
jgi:hypothetical protein